MSLRVAVRIESSHGERRTTGPAWPWQRMRRIALTKQRCNRNGRYSSTQHSN